MSRHYAWTSLRRMGRQVGMMVAVGTLFIAAIVLLFYLGVWNAGE